jgi:hypothetical protein
MSIAISVAVRNAKRIDTTSSELVTVFKLRYHPRMNNYVNGNSNSNSDSKPKRRIYPSLFSNPILGRYEKEPGGYEQTYDPYGVNTNPTFNFGDTPEGFAAVETPFPKTLQDAAGGLDAKSATRAALAGIYTVRGLRWAKGKLERAAKKIINKWKNRNKPAAGYESYESYESYEDWSSKFKGWEEEKKKAKEEAPAGYKPLAQLYDEHRLGSFKAESRASTPPDLSTLQRLLGSKIVSGLTPEMLALIQAKVDKKGALSDYLKGGILGDGGILGEPLPKPDPNNDLNNSLVMDVPEENQEIAEKIDPEKAVSKKPLTSRLETPETPETDSAAPV